MIYKTSMIYNSYKTNSGIYLGSQPVYFFLASAFPTFIQSTSRLPAIQL